MRYKKWLMKVDEELFVYLDGEISKANLEMVLVSDDGEYFLFCRKFVTKLSDKPPKLTECGMEYVFDIITDKKVDDVTWIPIEEATLDF